MLLSVGHAVSTNKPNLLLDIFPSSTSSLPYTVYKINWKIAIFYWTDSNFYWTKPAFTGFVWQTYVFCGDCHKEKQQTSSTMTQVKSGLLLLSRRMLSSKEGWPLLLRVQHITSAESNNWRRNLLSSSADNFTGICKKESESVIKGSFI